MTDVEMRDLVFRNFYETGIKPEYKFITIIQRFSERRWRYDPDLENDLVDEIYKLGTECCIKWYEGNYYIFDGRIYVTISYEILLFAFKLWISKMGMKISQKRKILLFKDELLPQIRLCNHLNPRLDIVAFKNGVLDLTEYEFMPFSPDYHCTYYHPYRFDKKAKCPLWLKFLKEVLPDKEQRTILQMFLGLGLIERGTVYNQCEGKNNGKVELCLILIGGGANGKSVIYNVAMGVFGKDRISGIDYDELTMAGDEGMRARTQLRNAIFNWTSDCDAKTFGRKRTGVFKRIVSGEPVSDRKIGGDVQMNYHMPYLIFNLNDLPYPEDLSLGFIRRLQFVSFDVTIPASKQNKTLSQDLIEEYSGIFNWILRGTREVRRRKFVFPSSEGNKRQVLLAQLQGNPIIAWVNAYGLRWEPGIPGEQPVRIATKYILQSINQFCEDNDAPIQSKQHIGTTLGKLQFQKKRLSSGYEYLIYGASLEEILEPYIIRNQVFFDDVDEETEEESYISDED